MIIAVIISYHKTRRINVYIDMITIAMPFTIRRYPPEHEFFIDGNLEREELCPSRLQIAHLYLFLF